MRIDAKSHVPIYLQIVEGIRGEIRSGVRKPGEGLPSLRALAVDLLVNPNTVQRAYEELERQGLITARRGIGMFVSGGAEPLSTERAEAQVLDAFARAVESGRHARLSTSKLRQIFDLALGLARKTRGSS
jgi:GntR family transcriptional regulator